jgi:hypothetical protein
MNAQSVVSKIDELCGVSSELDPDLILVTETWCNEQITNTFLAIPGYELINDLRKDRYDTDRGRGGGLLVYAKNNISVCVLPSDEPDAKHQYCKFKVKDVVIYLIYRSPSGGADSISGMAAAVRRCEKNCVFFR